MKIYCKKCGTKLEDVECRYYDEETGKKVHDLACPNISCERYCDFYGHNYEHKYFFLSNAKCKNCGYIPQNY